MKKRLLALGLMISIIFSCMGTCLALELPKGKTSNKELPYKEVNSSKKSYKNKQSKYAITDAQTIEGNWVKSGNRWWFKTKDGYLVDNMYSINGQVYAFDSKGWMITGWYKYNNGSINWYYFSNSGSMCKGWIYVGANWYYLDTTYGFMYENGLYEINGKIYYLQSSGAMFTGWYKEVWDDGSYDWYYFKSDGALAYGWQKINGVWYYLDLNYGFMYNDGTYKINNDIYYFLVDGTMFTGWHKEVWDDGSYDWYYFKGDGALAYNWQKINGVWYYLDPEYGNMHIGWLEIDDKWYYLNNNGALTTGWQLINGNWYYFNSNGVMATNTWIGNYYVEASGAMAINKWIGNYFVGPDGCWVQLKAGETILPIDNGDRTVTLLVGTIDTNMANQIFQQLNQYRASKGLYTLKNANSTLQNAVNLRSAECAILFSHIRPNGEDCFSVYQNSCAENIAYGSYLNADSVMNLWKNSAGHNANMLNTFATSVGIAVFKTRNGYTYCVQLFSWD